MNVYPGLDIRFPESRKAELIEAMKSGAVPPWNWRPSESFNDPSVKDYLIFHRDRVGADPPCTVWLYPESPGKLTVANIVPDPKAVRDRIPIERYVSILRDFDCTIAEPAAAAVEGLTSMDTHQRSLEDYFPAESIRLLEWFCTTSNAGDGGTHPSDQAKWMSFLLSVHRSRTDVNCDIFGACLRAKQWWPEDGIPDLVHEYDFAMRLLRFADQQATN
jgi:hypothetical protein